MIPTALNSLGDSRNRIGSTLEYRAVFEVTILAILSMSLTVDAITGFLAGSGASFQSLSLLYKAFAVSLMFMYLMLFSHRAISALLVIALSLLGSIYARVIITGDTEKAVIDLINIVKILTPLTTIFVLMSIYHANPRRAGFWTKAILVVSAATVLVNILAGVMGYGYATYDFAEASDVGSKGFFYAGNELSAVFVVVCGYILTVTYSRRGRMYWAIGAGLLVCGLVLGTKSAVVAILLLVITIPIAYERGRLFKLTARKLGIALLLASVIVVGYLAIWNILEAFGLASRIGDVIERRGVVGFIFSGREIYLAHAASGLGSSATIAMLLFGIGQSGVDAMVGKGSIEIDVVDLFLWYGLAGITYYFILVIWMLRWSARNFFRSDFPYGPGVLVTTIILILQSATAGHVVVSGMLGIPWAALVCLSMMRPGPQALRVLTEG